MKGEDIDELLIWLHSLGANEVRLSRSRDFLRASVPIHTARQLLQPRSPMVH